MGLLKKAFGEAIDKGKLGKRIDYIPFYKTGIDIFDYINGVRKADGTVEVGIQGGKIMMDVGNSGTGKTSKIIQQACFIADQYEEADVWHYDYERSTSKERVMALTGWSSEHYEEKYQIFQENISVETLFRACKEIERIKMENKEAIQIDTGKKDGSGKPIYILPPTIMIVDSVALLAPEDVEDDDELKGSMGATAIAKANTNVFKRIMSPMQNANIILMLVNHLTQKIDINPMARTKAQINYLKQDESIPGGKAVSYLTNTLTKLETGSKIEPDKEFGIKGFYLSGILVKSRSTEAGVSFKMVFEQKKGINNLLTNFVNLKDLGRITGAGRSFKLDTCPDVKFSLKEFQDKYYESKELRKAFDAAVREEYSKFLPEAGVAPTNVDMNKLDELIEEDIKQTTKKSTSKKKPDIEVVAPEDYELIDEENGVYQDTKGNYYIIEDGEYVEVEYEEE
jgi:hypothetical protein